MFKISIYIFAMFIILMFSFGCGNADRATNKYNKSMYIKKDLLVLDKNNSNKFIRNSEGSFVKIKDKLYFFYSCFYGATDYSKSNICYIDSNDQGLTWTKPVIFLKSNTNSNIMSISTLKLGKNIILFYLQKYKQNVSDIDWVNSLQDCKIVFRKIDENLNFVGSEKIITNTKLGFHVMNNDRVLKVGRRIFIPYATHIWKGKLDYFIHAKINLKYSDDNLTTFLDSNTSNINKYQYKYIMQEPGIVNIKDNVYMLYFRTNMGNPYYSISCDNGINWSEPTPMHIKAPQSPVTIHKLKNSNSFLIIYNKLEGKLNYLKDRNKLILASSYDAVNYKDELTLESSQNGFYCYSSIYELDNYLLIAYTAGNSEIGNFSKMKIVKVWKK